MKSILGEDVLKKGNSFIIDVDDIAKSTFSLLYVINISYIVLSLMPILWLFGLFPPIGKNMMVSEYFDILKTII